MSKGMWRTTVSLDRDVLGEARKYFYDDYRENISTSQLMRRVLKDYVERKRAEKEKKEKNS